LAAELSRIDAVHGVYYLFLHVWIRVFGISEFAVRFPSIVAAGLAVTATVLIGREFFGLRTGIVAGAVLIALPGFTVLAIDARSYALTIAAAAWLALLLLRLTAPRPAPRWMWGLYALGFLAAIWLWVFDVIMIPVHAALLVARRGDRTTWHRWLQALVLIVVGTLPIAMTTFAQRQQIAFLARRHYLTWHHILVQQWFGDAVVAIACWTLIAIAAWVAIRNTVLRRRIFGVTVWLTGPTLLLVLTNVAITPIYNARYTAVSLPAVALAVAVGAVALIRALAGRRAMAALAAAVIAATLLIGAVPKYLAQRGSYGFGADYRQVSEVIAAQADAGDAVIFDAAAKPSWRPRVAIHLYPGAFDGLVDVGLDTPFTQRAGIWDTTRPVPELVLSAYPVVWAVEVHGTASTDLHDLTALGYQVTATYDVHRTTVYRLEKENR
jgi:mannosyltransferase